MYDKIIGELLRNGAKRATHFITNKEIIRVVRTSYSFNGKFGGGNIELTITRGKPNYAEREFVKKWGIKGKAGIFFKYLPKKKSSPSKQEKRSKVL